MKVVIIAGGKWTRLGLTDIPKPMVQVAGKPILQRQIELAKRYWLDDIIILSGHLWQVIVDYFGDWSDFWVKIQHIIEKSPLGTAWAVKQIEHLLTERFFVFYGDTIMDINLQKMIDFDIQHIQSLWTLFVHPNTHPYDSDLAESDTQWVIKAFHPKPHPEWKYYHNLVNAALYILDPKIFSYIQPDVSSDFWKHIFPKIINDWDILRAYKTHEYIKDMWTLERLQQVENDIISWKVARLNMAHTQKAIFIDRDWVLNKEVDNLSHIDDLELLPHVAEWLKIINASEYLSLVVTNQPMIAKWFLKVSDLDMIHKKLETLVGLEWAYIHDIYYCPHHPDAWFPWEIPELKISCDCRKPNTGMIDASVEKYTIDVGRSFIIGDSTTDIQTGANAWLKTVLVRTGYAWDDGKYSIIPDFTFNDFREATNFIVNEYDTLVSQAEDIISNIPKEYDSYVILLGWLSRSWKTTFTKILTSLLDKHSTSYQEIHLDNRLLSKKQRDFTMDVRARYQYDKIVDDMQELFAWKPISVNAYNVRDRTVIENHSTLQLHSHGIVILDWVLALDIEPLRDRADLKIYCDIDENIRKQRFHDFYAYKWLSEYDIQELYDKRQEDEFSVVKNSQKYADIVIC